ncbi:prostaglandin E2 receptor EP3 subtype [Tachyglossus aculeatus]|uniref:prostaglandin E2 receptor EP3 subtype n=1 Tax=Tachyglossus aculeatus TaxID=9261 RepID=UPI0018F5F7B2|nr:prostaglandin E2 receptor EP3 subtype [Tachyglossus aculeatus]
MRAPGAGSLSPLCGGHNASQAAPAPGNVSSSSWASWWWWSSGSGWACVPPSVGIPLAMMVTGLVGNGLALLLVGRAYRRRGGGGPGGPGGAGGRRRSFLLGLGGLALTDLAGQLLTSPVVLAVYLSGRPWQRLDPSGRLCHFFGLSMTAFGLCSLFLAGALALERALAIGAPHWYAAHLRAGAPRAVLLAAWLAGLAFALLPAAGVGHYGVQWPGTWCFISTAPGPGGRTPRGRRFFAAAFAGLGLAALAVTVAANLATVRALLARCRPPAPAPRWGRVTAETVVQLTGIVCVLAACWSPLLIMMLKMTLDQTSMEPCKIDNFQTLEHPKECNFFLTAIRLASLNQILDPWVYLLLRKIVLRKFCQVANAISCCSKNGQKGQPIPLSNQVIQTRSMKENI